MIRIVSIKFRDAGKQYDFNAQNLELNRGTEVIVETDRGRALGKVVVPPREIPRTDAPEGIKNIIRIASDEDRALARTNAARESEAFRFCQLRVQERKMDMKLVRAEYLFDGSKIIFYFTADGRVDFRELVKDLAHHFHTRIEMRQIGVRDEAKLTGGIGICGRELCCCTFLTEFTPVSVKMAKEQGLALNPNKISGQCGRLLCCLSYEFETYCSMKKCLPKCGRKVQVEGGEGEIVDQNVLAQTVTVRLGDGKKMEVPADQLENRPAQPAEAPSRQRSKSDEVPPQRERPKRRPAPPAPGPVSEKPVDPAPPEQGVPEGESAEQTEGRKRSRRRRRPRRK
ncbi:stage 0 sporulation family protein [Desulfuromonas sp. TF]|uniref:PSP1 domain-containing protein n=1 Tax=Desulfuromonas sp. TF TaxID=1232410 RepID=UPI000403F8EC|nr:stage 0 sporulation family protein [Desulfuromonas sp. TF]